MTQKPARASPSSEATTAFADLRWKIPRQRTAIEGLTAAKEQVSDYSFKLRAMASRLDRLF